MRHRRRLRFLQGEAQPGRARIRTKNGFIALADWMFLFYVENLLKLCFASLSPSASVFLSPKLDLLLKLITILCPFGIIPISQFF